jgi:hypothetical protein
MLQTASLKIGIRPDLQKILAKVVLFQILIGWTGQAGTLFNLHPTIREKSSG